MSSQFRQGYEFGPFRLDVAGRRLLRNQEAVTLSPKAFDTLLALVRKSGHLVCKEELMKEVWPCGSVEEGNLSHCIYLLRKALGHDADGNLYIETVSKYGYRLVTSATEIAEGAEPSSQRRTPARALLEEGKGGAKQAVLGPRPQVKSSGLVPAARRKKAHARRSPWVLIFSCVVLICASLFSYRWMGKSDAGHALRTRSIAVLPFKRLAVESKDDHLGLAVTNATIKRLSTQRQFTVRPSSAVSKYTDAKDDSLAIGRRLDVDAVLEGIVQRSGDDVRVTVQLINVGDGQALWAQKFDAQGSNILALQDTISAQVAEALELELTSRDNKELAKRETQDTEADQPQSLISPEE